MKKFDPIIEVDDDGLLTPTVREWSLHKYRLLGTYCDIFSTGMKNQWDQLVYIDLFAGAGYSKIKETNQRLLSSALIAMSIPTPFTKYILCEVKEKRFKALKERVKRDYSHLNVELIYGDSNQNIEQIKNAIPNFSKGNTLLPFCFVDPYSLNLKFSTISKLGENLMDFLILQALHMDANRNFNKYMKENNRKIAEYIGDENWREQFKENGYSKKDFIKFLADKYQDQMAALGYRKVKQMHQIRSNVKNLPLYYLAFFSKNKRGNDFFNKVLKNANPQLKLNL